MKCAIFFLIFCVFETVFTDQLEEDLKNLRDTSINQLHGIVRRLSTALQEAIHAAAGKKGMTPFGLMLTGYCFQEFDEIVQMGIRNDGYFGECEECHNKAAKAKNLKVAKKCCIDIIAAFENKAKIVRANTKTCIAQYVNDSRAAVARESRKGLRNN